MKMDHSGVAAQHKKNKKNNNQLRVGDASTVGLN